MKPTKHKKTHHGEVFCKLGIKTQNLYIELLLGAMTLVHEPSGWSFPT
jgi:hypothetical protein